MEPNQNPPCEREWTPEEMEEFFSSQDAVTGMFNGTPINKEPFCPAAYTNNCGDQLAKEWEENPPTVESIKQIMDWWNQKSIPDGARIVITSIVPPEQGWPIAMHCPICKVTTFLLSPWAIKPEKGDYWKMNDVCASDEHFHEHNMRIAMKSFDWSITRVLG